MIQKVNYHNYQFENHWYPKVLNSQINPLVNHFFNMTVDRIITRYCHLHPTVKREFLYNLIHYKPKFFYWAGCDLFNVASTLGKRQMVLIETNSCPSGQKSTPQLSEQDDMGGYGRLVRGGIKSFLKNKRLIDGIVCVVYDKNKMESSGYAYALSEYFEEDVYLVEYYNGEKNNHIKFENQTLFLRAEGKWQPIKFVFRYLTQKPWNRLPISSKTVIFNPIIVCLAGGRNKMLASKAYDFFNTELREHDISIKTPETFWDIRKQEIPLYYQKFGGHIVVKNPYSNAGQGIYLITNKKELDAFMLTESGYENYIVQSLIGNFEWSSSTEKGKLYHVGTLPNKKNETYVSDIRMMIHKTSQGFRPLALYSRRSELPLPDKLNGQASWPILGTNLSIKIAENKWETDVKRLITMDQKDFNKLGLGIDDLIEAFIQTLFATIAIDKMATRLVGKNNLLKKKLFYSLNADDQLIREFESKLQTKKASTV